MQPGSTPQQDTSRRRNSRAGAIAWAVVAVWLAGTAYAFWAFEFKQQRAFESPRTVLFDTRAREHSAEAWFRATVAPRLGSGAGDVATVVHVYTPNCSCNRFTHPHLARIVAGYRGRGVNFFVAGVTPGVSAAAAAAPAGLQQVVLPVGGELSWIEATPAALVFDASGRLVYFGPYSDGARCGQSGGLVERVLDRMLGGQALRPQPFYGGGCFCSGGNNV